jgi:hypothetical protein
MGIPSALANDATGMPDAEVRIGAIIGSGVGQGRRKACKNVV